MWLNQPGHKKFTWQPEETNYVRIFVFIIIKLIKTLLEHGLQSKLTFL